MGLLTSVVGQLIGALRNATAAGGTLNADSIQPLVSLVQYLADYVRDVFENADSNAGRDAALGGYAGDDIAQVAQDLADITDHTYTVVVPHSLAWLRGNVIVTLVDPLRKLVAGINREVKFLLGWRSQIDTWRNKFVDPNLSLWIGFHKWFYQWPIGVLRTWHDWFQHPAQFAAWATPPLIGPIIGYLADPAHELTRDNLSQIMLNAWHERPDATWDKLLAYMVTDL